MATRRVGRARLTDPVLMITLDCEFHIFGTAVLKLQIFGSEVPWVRIVVFVPTLPTEVRGLD